MPKIDIYVFVIYCYQIQFLVVEIKTSIGNWQAAFVG